MRNNCDGFHWAASQTSHEPVGAPLGARFSHIVEDYSSILPVNRYEFRQTDQVQAYKCFNAAVEF